MHIVYDTVDTDFFGASEEQKFLHAIFWRTQKFIKHQGENLIFSAFILFD